jgi:predicted ArsR family transcriptional regulator
MGTSSKNKSKKIEIPTTGRIGRWAKIIEQETNRETAENVMKDVDQYMSTSNYSKKAAWVHKAVHRLKELVGTKKSVTIMEKCGKKCCGPTSRKKAKKLMEESESVEEFVKKLNAHGLGGGRLVIEGDTIKGGYDTCYCGQVKHTKEPFDSLLYCQCSVGWYTQLFESALNTPVDVELVQSIINGADTCEFIINIQR